VTRVDRHHRTARALGRPAVVVRALVALSALFGLAVAGPVPHAWATHFGASHVAATGTPGEEASTLPVPAAGHAAPAPARHVPPASGWHAPTSGLPAGGFLLGALVALSLAAPPGLTGRSSRPWRALGARAPPLPAVIR
jgi:hypothetical protein